MSDQTNTGGTGEITGTAEGVVTPPESPVAQVEADVKAVEAPVEADVHAVEADKTKFLTDAEESVRGLLKSIVTRAEKSAVVAEVEKLAQELKAKL